MAKIVTRSYAAQKFLGIQARILGNSITEMKAFYRTYYCKI